MVFFIFNTKVQILKTGLFPRSKQCKEIRAAVKGENFWVPEKNRTALLKALMRGCAWSLGVHSIKSYNNKIGTYKQRN